MKKVLCAALIGAIVIGFCVNDAHATGEKKFYHSGKQISEAEAEAISKSNSKSNSNAKANNGGINIDNSNDNDAEWWWFGNSLGSTSNVAPHTGNYEGTRDYRISGGPFGFSVPIAMHDEAAIYRDFGEHIAKVWASDVVVTPDVQFLRALQCNFIPGLEDTLEDVGKVCPDN